MADLVLATAGPPDRLTGGQLYDNRMARELRLAGRAVEAVAIPGRLPDPDRAASRAGAALLDRLPDGAVVVADAEALPALVPALGRHAARLRVVALIHHPVALEPGLNAAAAARLRRLERRGLGLCRGAICPSAHSAAAVAGYGIDPVLIAVVPPGLDLPPSAPPRAAEGPVRLLSVGSLTPRKGHAVLVAALGILRDKPWTLVLIGAGAGAATLGQAIAACGLADCITLAGERPPERLSEAYRAADAFVLASLHEGYGMVFAEAMGHGLPVVGTTAGAIPEVVPAAAGMLVPPGDVEALALALGRVIDDATLRRRCGTAARAHAEALPGWVEAARRFGAAVDRLAAR